MLTLLVLLLCSAGAGGCAGRDCEREALEARSSGGEQEAARVRARCEDQLAQMRDKLAADQRARQTAARRNAFMNRASARRRGY